MLTYRPILVVGQPRSGTSTTARLLHERFDVCMKTRDFLVADKWNYSVTPHISLTDGALKPVGYSKVMYLEYVRKIIDNVDVLR